MVIRLMMFCPIIGVIESAGSRVYAKLFLAFSVPEPVESHVHGFCAFWRYFAIDDSILDERSRMPLFWAYEKAEKALKEAASGK